MDRMYTWLGLAAMTLAMAGCGKREAQVVTPRAPQATEVVIWIDQTGITQAQLQREAARLFSNVAQNVPQDQIPAVQARMLQRAVDNLVVRELVRAEMDRSGVLISQEEMDDGKLALEKGLSEGQSLIMLLAAANVSVEELEDNLRLDLFKNKVLKEQLNAALAMVNEASAREYYEQNPKEFTSPAGRLVSHILIRVPGNADEAARADARSRTEGIRKALAEGANFAELAREVSQCASRRRGGALGVIQRDRESPAFEEAVYTQEIGAIGEIVESPVGYHIIMVTGEQEEKIAPFEQVSDRLQAMLRGQIQNRITTEYIDGLRQKATIRLDGPLAELVGGKPENGDNEPAAESPDTLP